MTRTPWLRNPSVSTAWTSEGGHGASAPTLVQLARRTGGRRGGRTAATTGVQLCGTAASAFTSAGNTSV